MHPQAPVSPPQTQTSKEMRTLPLLISSIVCTIACLTILPAVGMVFFNDVGDKAIYFWGIFLGIFAIVSFFTQVITACITCWRFMRVSRLAKSVVLLHLVAVGGMILLPILYIGVSVSGLIAASASVPGSDTPGFITIILSGIFSILYFIVPLLFILLPTSLLSAITCSFVLVAKPPVFTPTTQSIPPTY